MSETEINPIKIASDEREVILLALKLPGWAVSMDLVLDGTDAIKSLRSLDIASGVSYYPTEYELGAIKKAFSFAIEKGVFGPGEELIELLKKLDLMKPRSRRG